MCLCTADTHYVYPPAIPFQPPMVTSVVEQQPTTMQQPTTDQTLGTDMYFAKVNYGIQKQIGVHTIVQNMCSYKCKHADINDVYTMKHVYLHLYLMSFTEGMQVPVTSTASTAIQSKQPTTTL